MVVQKAGRQNGGHVDRRVGQAVADGRNGGTGVEERAREIFSTVWRAPPLNGLARTDARHCCCIALSESNHLTLRVVSHEVFQQIP